MDLLPALLLPLAGPEQFDEDEAEQLPLDLQYLPEDKTREPDPDIRTMLLEALLKVLNSCSTGSHFVFYLLCLSVYPSYVQLCCTKFGREYLREKKVYLVLRELHKWEQDGGTKEACEKVVQVLIGDEPEQDNLEDIATKEESTH